MSLAAAIELLEDRRLLAAAPTGRGKTTPLADKPQIIDYGGIANPIGFQIGGRWGVTASGGNAGVGSSITLTYSFVPDGTTLTNGNGEGATPSVLLNRLNAKYGNQATWLPLFQQAFDSWGAVSGITYIYEPNDDGVIMSQGVPGLLGVRGDVRIGGHSIDGTSNVLAYNYFPSFADMTLDTDEFLPGGFFTSTAANSRPLRNVTAHEHGHGLGFNHVDPINSTKLMEAFASGSFDMVQFDDMLAVQRNYGDFYEKGVGNNTAANANNRGTLSNGSQTIPNLATSTATDQDWFKFTLTESHNVSMTASPFGPTYLQGSQGGSTSSYNAQMQKNIQLALYASDGTTQLAISNINPLGAAESINLNLPAGTYFMRVNDEAGQSTQSIQSYTLATTVSNPQASAFINAVSPDPRTTTVSSIAINFNEAVNGFDLSDLTLSRDGFSESLAGATLNTANNINYTLTGLNDLTGRIGQYTLTLDADASGITTVSGSNPLLNDATESWLMAAHFGTSADEVMRFVPNGAMTDVFINNDTATPTYSFVAANVSTLTVNGGAGDDTLVIDFSGGSQLPAGGVSWNGGTDGANGDTLRVIGENTSDTFNIGGTSVTRSSPLSPTVNIAGNEFLDLTKGTYTSFTDLASGLIVGNQTTVVLSASQTMRNLIINNGGLVRMTQSGNRVLRTQAVAITGTGKLDLFNNAMIVDYAGASPVGAVEDMIQSGRNGGLWNGPGITSTTVRTAEIHNVAVAVIEATDYKAINGALFFNQSVDDSALVIRSTYYGDTDFNGVVNFDDYSRTDAGFNFGRTGWFNGDFDLNGSVNFDDYSLIDLAFNTQGQ